jgi:glycosyltransferase involved in cell wall biosynthesis
MKTKIVHIINSFEYGGAEMMLGNLLARADRARFEPVVVSLIDAMTLADRVVAAGVPIRVLGMKPGVPDPRGVARLARLLRRERAGVIQTWMDHSNLIGGLAARLSTRCPLVWGVHHANHLPGLTKRTTLMTVAACARLSRGVPSAIVCCSEAARTAYRERGFAAAKLTVIPNGFDTEAFRPDPSARDSVRRELGLGSETRLVGLVARYDPFKDHANFLRAAGELGAAYSDVHFLMCGQGVDESNAALVAQVEGLGLRGRCRLLGPRRDVARIQASLEVAASSSVSEAFPLAVGEAMSCGVPCVATDVGDSALIVGDAGRIVPPRDPGALAGAWRDLLDLDPDPRRRLGSAARRRIRERYDLEVITRRYEDLYQALTDARRGASEPLLVSVDETTAA